MCWYHTGVAMTAVLAYQSQCSIGHSLHWPTSGQICCPKPCASSGSWRWLLCCSCFHYVKAMAVYMKCVNTVFAYMDDKAKVPVGEAGEPTSTNVRNHPTLAGKNHMPTAMDHDHTWGSFTPSVTLQSDISCEEDGSFYRGQVDVCFKDSVFTPSNPFLHVVEWTASTALDNIHSSVVFLYTNGGSDHRLTLTQADWMLHWDVKGWRSRGSSSGWDRDLLTYGCLPRGCRNASRELGVVFFYGCHIRGSRCITRGSRSSRSVLRRGLRSLVGLKLLLLLPPSTAELGLLRGGSGSVSVMGSSWGATCVLNTTFPLPAPLKGLPEAVLLSLCQLQLAFERGMGGNGSSQVVGCDLNSLLNCLQLAVNHPH